MAYVSVKAIVFFCTGVFSTMPIVTVSFGDRLVSLFSLLFAIFFVLVLVMAIDNPKRVDFAGQSRALFFWLVLSIFASLSGFILFQSEPIWLNQLLGYVPKIVLYLALLLLALRAKEFNNIAEVFLKGFVTGCVLNLIWSVIEGLSFYLYGVVLNDALFTAFSKTLPDERPTMTIVTDGIIRASGFNFDPAHMGGIIPIMFLYSILRRNIYFLLLTLTSLAFSGSTTALVSCALAAFITIGKLGTFKSRNSAIDTKNYRVLSALFGMCILVTISLNDNVRESIYSNAIGFYSRTSEIYVDNRDQGPRYIYHAYLPQAILNSGVTFFTGSGFGTASHPYVSDPLIRQILDVESYYPFDPESTYISYLFDTGILGLFCYMYCIVSSLLLHRKKLDTSPMSALLYASLSGILFAGIFYHYILTAYQMLILIIAVSATAKSENSELLMSRG
jgi:O-Antigen ligase